MDVAHENGFCLGSMGVWRVLPCITTLMEHLAFPSFASCWPRCQVSLEQLWQDPEGRDLAEDFPHYVRPQIYVRCDSSSREDLPTYDFPKVNVSACQADKSAFTRRMSRSDAVQQSESFVREFNKYQKKNTPRPSSPPILRHTPLVNMSQRRQFLRSTKTLFIRAIHRCAKDQGFLKSIANPEEPKISMSFSPNFVLLKTLIGKRLKDPSSVSVPPSNLFN